MSIISMVPFSVRQRGRGLVRDPAVHGYSLLDPQWVPVGTTVSDRKKASMIKKADRVIAVLSRFVARVARIHRFRKIFSNGDLAWSVIMEREDTQQRNEREANLRNLIVMPEEQLYAHWRQQMAAHQEIGNLWNLMNLVKAKRAEREQRIRENQIIWTELNFNQIGMSVRSNEPMLNGFRVGSTVITPSWVPMSFTNIGVPVRLHNPQVVAPVRRVQMGRFAALDDDE
jgi:hypothetical protein